VRRLGGALPAAIALALGAVCLLRFDWRRRSQQRKSASAATALSLVTLAFAAFWAGSVQAQELGGAAAQAADTSPGALAEVTVTSEKALDVQGDLVAFGSAVLPDNQTSYRYVGLRLLAYSNDRWFLVPGRRKEMHSTVLILRDSESIRVQIASSGSDAKDATVTTQVAI
jgi:hypothetical protein